MMMMVKQKSMGSASDLLQAGNNVMVMRRRRIQKLCYDVRISLVGGILTLLFLRSCLSGGEMASPLDDLRQLQRGRRILFNAILINNMSSVSSDHLYTHTLQQQILPAHHKNAHQDPIIMLLLTPQSHPALPEDCRSSTPEELQPYRNFALRSIQNTMEYCRLHGIEMHYSYVDTQTMHPNQYHDDHRNDGGMKDYNYVMAQKLTSIYRAVKQAMNMLKSDEVEDEDVDRSDNNRLSSDRGLASADWIWWIDGDDKSIIFTNMSMELQVSERYGDNYNMVVFSDDSLLNISSNNYSNGDGDADVVEQHYHRGGALITSLLIRPCQWSLDVLDLLRKQFMTTTASSSSSLSQLVTKPGLNAMERFFLRNESSSWEISSKIFLESSSNSSLYGVVRNGLDSQVDIAERSTVTNQPLLTHFRSCHPHSFCLPHDQSIQNQCPIHLIERAFSVSQDQTQPSTLSNPADKLI